MTLLNSLKLFKIRHAGCEMARLIANIYLILSISCNSFCGGIVRPGKCPKPPPSSSIDSLYSIQTGLILKHLTPLHKTEDNLFTGRWNVKKMSCADQATVYFDFVAPDHVAFKLLTNFLQWQPMHCTSLSRTIIRIPGGNNPYKMEYQINRPSCRKGERFSREISYWVISESFFHILWTCDNYWSSNEHDEGLMIFEAGNSLKNAEFARKYLNFTTLAYQKQDDSMECSSNPDCFTIECHYFSALYNSIGIILGIVILIMLTFTLPRWGKRFNTPMTICKRVSQSRSINVMVRPIQDERVASFNSTNSLSPNANR